MKYGHDGDETSRIVRNGRGKIEVTENMFLLLFPVFFLLGKHVYENYFSRKVKPSVNGTARQTNPPPTKEPVRFYPPAYIQRYQTVVEILEDPKFEGKLRKVLTLRLIFKQRHVFLSCPLILNTYFCTLILNTWVLFNFFLFFFFYNRDDLKILKKFTHSSKHQITIRL